MDSYPRTALFLRFSGCAEGDDDLFVAVEEIEDLGSARDDPGEGVEQVERGDGVEVGEDGVYPDHPEHAGTHYHNNGGTTVLPSPREAAMVQSIKAEMQ